MKRSAIVIEGAQYLFNAEFALDTAYGETATLAQQLVRLRVKGGLAATVGQPAVDEVTSALSALASARGALLRAHGELADVKIKVGCRTVATGGHDKPDEIVGVNESGRDPPAVTAA